MASIKTVNRCVEIARALAPEKRKDIRNHHVSILLRKNKIVSIGMNSPKTDRKNLKYKYRNRQNAPIGHCVGTHSESHAVNKYPQEDYSKLTLVNIRIDRNQKLANSCPCLGCKSLLDTLGLKKIIYSNQLGGFSELCTR